MCVGGGGRRDFVVTERTHIHRAPVTLLARTPALSQTLTKKDKKIAVITQLKDERSRNGSYNGTGKNGR